MVPARPNNTVIHSLRFWLGFLIFGLLLAVPPYSFGNPRFERFAARHGLFQNRINAIVQDRRGFLWLATDDGLVKYDGYTFITFRITKSENYILSLCWSRTGDLWVSFIEKLIQFDIQREMWKEVPSSPEMNRITSLLEDPTGLLWCGTRYRGLFNYDPVTKQATHIVLDPKLSLSDFFGIQKLHQYKNGDIWAGTYNHGLYQLNPKTGAVHHYQNIPGETESLSGNQIWCVFEDPYGNLYIGTSGGLDQLIKKEDRICFTHYLTGLEKQGDKGSDIVTSGVASCSGQIWIGTYSHGVFQLDPQTGQTSNYSTDPNEPKTISSNNILTIFEDRSENLWIGTYGGGLFKLNQRQLVISHIQNDPNKPDSLNCNQICSIYEGRDRTIWIGTFVGGLNQWDRKSGRISHFLPEMTEVRGKFKNRILSILEDSSGTLWIGTYLGRIYNFDRLSGQFRLIHSYPYKAERAGIDVFFEDRSGNIWAGTRSNCLIKMHKSGKVLAIYPIKNELNQSPPIITAIYADDFGTLWLGTNNGLFISILRQENPRLSMVATV